ncbi:Tn3 family transposase [Mesorhizobium sp. M0815]
MEAFKTSGDRVILDASTLQSRLLLWLYGLGTNAGLKRVSAGTEGVSYADLLHERRWRAIGRSTAGLSTATSAGSVRYAVDELDAWAEICRRSNDGFAACMAGRIPLTAHSL